MSGSCCVVFAVFDNWIECLTQISVGKLMNLLQKECQGWWFLNMAWGWGDGIKNDVFRTESGGRKRGEQVNTCFALTYPPVTSQELQKKNSLSTDGFYSKERIGSSLSFCVVIKKDLEAIQLYSFLPPDIFQFSSLFFSASYGFLHS